MPANPSEKVHHVPTGRSLADVPVDLKNPKPCPPAGYRAPPNVKLTIRKFITEDESKEYLARLLMDLGTKRKKGPWRDYLEFYRLNQSGDFEACKPEVKKYVEKMKKDLADEWFEQQDL